MTSFTAEEVQQLFHNRFVVILGDSIQRSVYKDLVVLLQKDDFLTNAQLKAKGEFAFEHDFLVEGGKFAELNNGTKYREVRQYRTNHHLVRFYFLTRVYSDYMESILADFKAGPQPDVLIINSCVWDISRYGKLSMDEYKENLGKLFTRLDEVILPECLLIWNMAMPLAQKIIGGFLLPEFQHLDKTLRFDIVEGNFYSATLANCHKFDILDLHYHFRFDGQNRLKDGVHWNQIVHRKISQLLLAHIADAWGVKVPEKKPVTGPDNNERRKDTLQWCNKRALQRSPVVPRAYPSSNRGPVYEKSKCYAPRQCKSIPSSQVGYRPPFFLSGPSASYQSSHFYDDSPTLTNNYCLGYTSFEHQGSLRNGMSRNVHLYHGASVMPNTSSSANISNVPMQNFSSFPVHALCPRPLPPVPQWNHRNSSHGLVMRRPQLQRGEGPPYYRQHAVPYGRY